MSQPATPSNKLLIAFVCVAQTLGTDLNARRYERLMNEVAKDDSAKIAIADFAYLLACTQHIEFDPTLTHPIIQTLKDFWAKKDAWTGDDLYLMRLDIPHKLIELWTLAWSNAQQLWDVPREQVPTATLTKAERDEVTQPDSPLASGERLGRKPK